jgi:hypothetical protein
MGAVDDYRLNTYHDEWYHEQAFKLGINRSKVKDRTRFPLEVSMSCSGFREAEKEKYI